MSPFGSPRLTRRRLLAAGVGVLAGAAAAALEPAIAAARRVQLPTLWPAPADVWALSIDVEGTPADAQLSLDGQPLATAPVSDGFTAVVPLGPGENTLTATGSEMWQALHHPLRPRADARGQRAAADAAGDPVHIHRRGDRRRLRALPADPAARLGERPGWARTVLPGADRSATRQPGARDRLAGDRRSGAGRAGARLRPHDVGCRDARGDQLLGRERERARHNELGRGDGRARSVVCRDDAGPVGRSSAAARAAGALPPRVVHAFGGVVHAGVTPVTEPAA